MAIALSPILSFPFRDLVEVENVEVVDNDSCILILVSHIFVLGN